MSQPPPPPPPHGENPRTTAGGSGLPPGKYDIFIIPEHSAGSGFLYLPSLKPQWNSFAAGVVSTLAVVIMSNLASPMLASLFSSPDKMWMMLWATLVGCVGIAAFLLGRHQTEPSGRQNKEGNGHGDQQRPGGGGYGGANSWRYNPPPQNGPSPNQAPPPPPPPQHEPPRGGGGGPYQSWQEQSRQQPQPEPQPQPQPRPKPQPQPQAQPPPPPPPPPPQPKPDPEPQPKPQEPKREEPKEAPKPQPKPAPDPKQQPQPTPPKTEPPPKGAWEKAREEMRRREEERKAKEAEAKKKEEEAKKKEETARRIRELREREARERERREKEARERELKEKLRQEQEAREKERLERELREKIERELREKVEQEAKEREAREREARAREAKLREEARKREEERAKAERERLAARERERKEREERAARLRKEQEEARLRKEQEEERLRKEQEEERLRKEQEEARMRKEQEEKEKEEKARNERKGTAYAYSSVGEKTSMWPNGKPPSVAPSQAASTPPTSRPAPYQAPPSPSKPAPSPTKPAPPPTKSTASASATGTEDTYSYRPYDTPKKPATRKKSVSDFSESSWAPSHSTARTTPPPSTRGPYTTNDPQKIVIKAVYGYLNQFSKTPASQLISGVGPVTDGLILRITSAGLFVDDDVRGVAQREWDIKAWTLKLVEFWCPVHAVSAQASNTPGSVPTNHPFFKTMPQSARRSAERGATKTMLGEEAVAYIDEFGRTCSGTCRKAGSGKPDGLHLLRATIRDQEGKRYLFVVSEEEAWKIAPGLAALRGSSQVRALGVAGFSSLESKTLLDTLGWGG